MGSISSTNPGVTNLLQTLASIDSPLLSSPSVVSALQNASPADVVQLSTAANQLENVDLLFGGSDGSSNSSNSTDLTNLFASLEDPTAQSATATSGATMNSSDQAASAQSSLQTSELETLLGTEPTDSSNSLFDLIG